MLGQIRAMIRRWIGHVGDDEISDLELAWISTIRRMLREAISPTMPGQSGAQSR